MDDADRAQVQIEIQLAQQLERAASLARQALGHPATSTRCVDCGAEIEAVRVVYGFGTCASCAQEAEYFARHGRTYR